MEYAVGIASALGVGLFGTLARFDRERVFYPLILVVAGHYYVPFAHASGKQG